MIMSGSDASAVKTAKSIPSGLKTLRDPDGHGPIGAFAPTEPPSRRLVPKGNDPRVRCATWHTYGRAKRRDVNA